jgi:GWxTD domain-containing protein
VLPGKVFMKLVVSTICLLSVVLTGPLFAVQNQKKLRDEEKQDYYHKWLSEDVVYIVGGEEKQVFQKLTTAEEKDAFIEQFWQRRDPDPRTPTNEFKDEHYRRIAYVNENFKSGIAGWKTDRGRIYIIHGPPDSKESFPTGGQYEREPHEGGGFTSVYPFERWWYRYLEGVGSDITLEFVDVHSSNEYSLALNPEQKDALLNVPGLGPTLAEEFGGWDKSKRPYFVSNYGEDYPGINNRAKDSPFRRYETYMQVQAPPVIKYKDLQEVVKINISYNQLTFACRDDYIRLTDQQVLAPVTLQLENKELTFREANGVHTLNLAVYGIVTTITNKIILEFEDEVTTSYRTEELEQGRLGSCTYQKTLPLDSKMRYKVDLVVKDLNSGKIGTLRRALIPPAFSTQKLALSPPILSGFIRQLTDTPDEHSMFILGDVWIRPSVTRRFLSHDPLGIYLQIYNVPVDQATLLPSLTVTYRLLKNGQPIRTVVDTKGESVQLYSDQRVVLIKAMGLKDLESGKYTVEVKVEDQVGQQMASTSADFQVEVAAGQVATAGNPPQD